MKPVTRQYVAAALFGFAVLYPRYVSATAPPEDSHIVIDQRTTDSLDDAVSPSKTGDIRRFRVALDIGHTPRVAGAAGADGTMEYEFNRRMVHLIAADLQK